MIQMRKPLPIDCFWCPKKSLELGAAKYVLFSKDAGGKNDKFRARSARKTRHLNLELLIWCRSAPAFHPPAPTPGPVPAEGERALCAVAGIVLLIQNLLRKGVREHSVRENR